MNLPGFFVFLLSLKIQKLENVNKADFGNSVSEVHGFSGSNSACQFLEGRCINI